MLLAVDPAGTTKALLAVQAATILSWLPWIVLFSVANGFMEVLWFHGSWLGAFRDVIGTSAAMHVTSVAFAVFHVIVYWDQPITLRAVGAGLALHGLRLCLDRSENRVAVGCGSSARHRRCPVSARYVRERRGVVGTKPLYAKRLRRFLETAAERKILHWTHGAKPNQG